MFCIFFGNMGVLTVNSFIILLNQCMVKHLNLHSSMGLMIRLVERSCGPTLRECLESLINLDS